MHANLNSTSLVDLFESVKNTVNEKINRFGFCLIVVYYVGQGGVTKKKNHDILTPDGHYHPFFENLQTLSKLKNVLFLGIWDSGTQIYKQTKENSFTDNVYQ